MLSVNGHHGFIKCICSFGKESILYNRLSSPSYRPSPSAFAQSASTFQQINWQTMSSSESQPLLQDGNLEERQSGTRQSHHGSFVEVSYDNSTRKQTRRFLSSIYGHYAVLLLVSMDVGCIFADFLISLYICDNTCGEGHGVGDGLPKAQDALGIVSLVFSCLFMVELLASIWAFGLESVKPFWAD